MPAVLRAENLTKRYGELIAVDDLTLEVRAGEVLGLLGPNGAGKTTSIAMLCGLLRPDDGRVLLHGRPLTDRALVGLCPQNIVVWTTLTCREQLEFVGEMYGLTRAAARKRADALLDAMGLTAKRHALAKNLSGGMQRRLNLILALVHDPEVVVLDEPEAGLDPQSRVLVREYIQSLARKKTILVTTHNMDEAERVADRVVIMDHGKVLAEGTPEELKHGMGPGDVLEIALPARPADSAMVRLREIVPAVSRNGNTVLLRAPGIVDRMSAILEVLKAEGQKPEQVKLRENSLEDVFLSLTGRSLRE